MKKLFVLIVILIVLLPAGEMMSQSNGQNGYKVRTVVIDAGHGGRDPGAIGVTGIREKDVCLAVALKLEEYINQHLPEVKVIQTRRKDEFVELHERASIANRNNADLFISIHANSIGSRNVSGTETYVLGLHRTAQNLEVAKRENSVILLEDNHVERYDGFDPTSPEGHIIFSLFQDAFLEQSILFASKVEDQFANRAMRRSRGVKQAGFLVLYQTTMPSVLVELGFLSNPNEERYLNSSEGQAYLASALFRAFRDYKEAMESRGIRRQSLAEIQTSLEAETPKKENVIAEKPVYKVQIYATQNHEDKNREVFKNVEFEIESTQNVYRFLVGAYSSREEAARRQQELARNGFPDAFIVPYFNGNRISFEEAASIE